MAYHGALLLSLLHLASAAWPMDCFEAMRQRRLSGVPALLDTPRDSLKACVTACAAESRCRSVNFGGGRCALFNSAGRGGDARLRRDRSTHFFRRKGKCSRPAQLKRGSARGSRTRAVVKPRSSSRGSGRAGNWLSWSGWSKCSSECGPGRRSRVRACDRAKRCRPASGNIQWRNCDSGVCPRDHVLSRRRRRRRARWGQWAAWSPCAATCGPAYKSRQRRCSDAKQGCPLGSTVQLTVCSSMPCAAVSAAAFNSAAKSHGPGSRETVSREAVSRRAWTEWTACSVSCGPGIHVRSRPCEEAALCGDVHATDVGSCQGDYECGRGGDSAPVQRAQARFQWSAWREWTTCECGVGERQGVKMRIRNCAQVFACEGDGFEILDCACDGGPRPTGAPVGTTSWEAWDDWSPCFAGQRARTRVCPSFDDQDCPGSDLDVETCGMMQFTTEDPFYFTDEPFYPTEDPFFPTRGPGPLPGPNPGRWSQWGQWSRCSQTCGAGSRERRRTCPSGFVCPPDASGNPKIFTGGPGAEVQQELCGSPCAGQLRWGEWSPWSSCTRTCGGGERVRRRRCPTFLRCGEGVDTEVATCAVNFCAGRWGDWADWTGCSASCGQGVRTRARLCLAQPCQGDAMGMRQCFGPPCVGRFGDWAQWGRCSVTCDSGMRSRERRCSLGPGQCGGGVAREQDTCRREPCRGDWGPWQSQPCTVTCGQGQQFRTRQCSRGIGLCGTEVASDTTPCRLQACPECQPWGAWRCGVTCGLGVQRRERFCPAGLGPSTETDTCETRTCPTCGEWAAWRCSVTCGTGTQRRNRQCPPGAQGSSTETAPCLPRPCPECGLWSPWQCDRTCGRGTQLRRRVCPPGLDERTQEQQACNVPPCPQCQPWSAWQCDRTCGQGTERRQRFCPPELPSRTSEQQPCTQRACPECQPWSRWECDRTCGRGTQLRQRFCPPELPERTSEEEPCRQQACPTCQPWGQWQCDRTCGQGTQRRQRSCPPELGERTTEQGQCNRQACPSCQPWSAWQCDRTCGRGTRRRQRFCPPELGQSTSEQQSCNIPACPECGPWSQWSCSSSCGQGTQSRRRSCPVGLGPEFDSQPCRNQPCPECQPWGNWRCSTTCGEGTRSRRRSCPQGLGPLTDTQRSCNNPRCPECGVWGQWRCSTTCGPGTRRRQRSCPSGLGPTTDSQNSCQNPRCPECGPWSSWRCAVTCGTGREERRRSCPPGLGETTSQNQPCQQIACPVCGGWSPWRCGVTCGSGTQTRQRSCPRSLGAQQTRETGACRARACPVASDAAWGAWGRWQCSVTCGPGTERRTRVCASGVGRCGPGQTVETRACQATYCPLPSTARPRQPQPQVFQWAQWSFWACAVTCGFGTQVRTRSCPGGRGQCGFGESRQEGSCSPGQCRAQSVTWGQWQRWGQCSVSCDSGSRTRRRFCPQTGACFGQDSQFESCALGPCRRAPDPRPQLSQWGAWGCSVTCGSGTALRSRQCLGGFCSESLTERGAGCSAPPCVESGWGPWRAWSGCSTSCGPGSLSRTRPCVTRYLACTGNFIEVKECREPRPRCTGPNWEAWAFWGQCSQSCGGGIRTRRRRCPNGQGACGRGSVETDVCNSTPCSGVRGDFRQWENWTACTRTCGAGRRWRTRVCNVVNSCEGFNAQSESEFCNVQSCLTERRTGRSRRLLGRKRKRKRSRRSRDARRLFASKDQ